jgi:hypothetical protein
MVRGEITVALIHSVPNSIDRRVEILAFTPIEGICIDLHFASEFFDASLVDVFPID